ncbi:Dihydrolipoyl dehydrogenase [Sedimentisphaera cyanobacteriorum]|uniref:Dihydrolipoyl dehydrogenase n=1 Tax=Sedimentisphaera cyanobacteriorum TaxID=1940790 RepID=A0A1Q2HPV1_9BACT|nr:dihydrolipoyl dehydrogenase [Sedimentisphaera cyanobacteriorum]AQQ09477.1 Dihydrolipoyl dehydrogenase [Sedimentisphaera cyanobacteriorum]
MAKDYDAVIIGAGPGGYAAGIKCARNGLKTAVIERDKPGGTCLNYGCIPSKALLGSAEFIIKARHANLMGLDVSFGEPNWGRIQSRKDAIVKSFTSGVEGLLRSNGAELIIDDAEVKENGSVRLKNAGREISCEHIILASGSEPKGIPSIPFDGKKVISSKEALNLKEIPKSMVIIGGGVIGCEMGCLYASMGCKTTIIEALPRLLPREDDWAGRLLEKEFRKINLKALTDVKVSSAETSGDLCRLHLSSGEVLESEKVLVAVGRRPVISEETAKALSLELSVGEVVIDEKMQTSAKGVYALGDLAGKTYLAHGAYLEAEILADILAGKGGQIKDYHLVPRAVYSFPEAAGVGLTEKEAREKGIDYSVTKSGFLANGRSLAHNQTAGEVRIIKDKADGRIVGVSMVGESATEMISTARLIIGTNEKAGEVSFPHPTVSEVLKEAWMGAYGESIHLPPQK